MLSLVNKRIQELRNEMIKLSNQKHPTTKSIQKYELCEEMLAENIMLKKALMNDSINQKEEN